MSFCKQVCPWTVKRAREWSTWRGLMIASASLVTIFNPVLGLTVAKAVGVVIGAVDVAKDDSIKD